MAQFDVYENKNPNTKKQIPYLLDVQNDLLSGLGSTVVIPICPSAETKHLIMSRLTPHVEINGSAFIILTPQLASIHRKELGEIVVNVFSYSQEIIDALDFLMTGI